MYGTYDMYGMHGMYGMYCMHGMYGMYCMYGMYGMYCMYGMVWHGMVWMYVCEHISNIVIKITNSKHVQYLRAI